MLFVRFSHPLLPIFAVIASLGGIASGQVKPEPAKPDTAPIAPAKAAEGVGAAVDPTKYLIGSEDVLYIKTWREPDFSSMAAVRPDGKISMSLLGEFPAAGLTPIQLAADVKERVGKYVNNPDVSVIVQEVRSRKYYMDGEFQITGAFALVTPIKVYDAISVAHGFKEFANQGKVRIRRGGQVIKFNYKEVAAGKHMEQNVFVENGDHISVK
jgi:polysaccharide biosynthesis/export protein